MKLAGTWRAVPLENDRAKLRRVVQYVWLIRSSLTYNGSLSLTLVNSPPAPCAECQAPIHGGVSHENITCDSCVGGAAELVCSCSIRRLAGRLLPRLCSGAVCRVSLLRRQPCLRSGLAVCRVLRCLRSGPLL